MISDPFAQVFSRLASAVKIDKGACPVLMVYDRNASLVMGVQVNASVVCAEKKTENVKFWWMISQLVDVNECVA